MNTDRQRQALGAAAHWFARLGAAPDDAGVQHQWQAWHNADPQHQWAWQQVAALQAQLGSARGALGYGVIERAEQQGLGRQRRTLLKGLLLAAGFGTLGWRGYRQAPVWLADVRTAVGEQRTLRLSDGSRLTLDTASAVDIAFTASTRLLNLRAGELYLETAKDSRPLIVSSAEGQMRALGTRFAVRQEANATRLSVFEHAVAVLPANASGAPTVIEAGVAQRFDRDRLLQRSALAGTDDAWVNGHLVVDDWALGDLIAELQRYRSGYLGCAEAISQLRVSGAYALNDIDLALAAITRALPVRVSRHTRYWTRLEAV